MCIKTKESMTKCPAKFTFFPANDTRFASWNSIVIIDYTFEALSAGFGMQFSRFEHGPADSPTSAL